MAQRVLAVLGAVAIVLVAVVVRAAIDDGGGGGGSGNGGIVLVCATELADACGHLDGVTVIVEQAADTAARIASGEAQADGVDGWVTTSAWTEVLESRASDRLATSDALATSQVVVATDRNRTQAVTSLCNGTPLWKCLGDNAGAEWKSLAGGDPRWGAVKTGLPDADSATGLTVLASVASGFLGGTDFAANDFDPAGLPGWLAQMVAPSGSGERDPVGTLVTTRGKYTGVGDLLASVKTRAVDVLEPTPAVVATVVLVHLEPGDDLPSPTPIRDALVAAGWEPVDKEPGPPPTLKPGVMAALHTLWTEVTR